MTKLARSALLTSAALVAFANAPKPANVPHPANPGAAAAPTPAPAATGKAVNKRSNPELTAVRNDIPMPEAPINNRGSKTAYPFDTLVTAGLSFGVKNKTAAQIASIVSNRNKKEVVPKRDESGAIVYKMTKGKDANGADIEVPSKDAETVQAKFFFAVDTNPATDPDGATVRVFRKV